eukprot:g3260.t1
MFKCDVLRNAIVMYQAWACGPYSDASGTVQNKEQHFGLIKEYAHFLLATADAQKKKQRTKTPRAEVWILWASHMIRSRQYYDDCMKFCGALVDHDPSFHIVVDGRQKVDYFDSSLPSSPSIDRGAEEGLLQSLTKTLTMEALVQDALFFPKLCKFFATHFGRRCQRYLADPMLWSGPSKLLEHVKVKLLRPQYEKYMRILHDIESRGEDVQPPSPTITIDWIWHAHMIQPVLYRHDCVNVFKRVIHHHPGNLKPMPSAMWCSGGIGHQNPLDAWKAISNNFPGIDTALKNLARRIDARENARGADRLTQIMSLGNFGNASRVFSELYAQDFKFIPTLTALYRSDAEKKKNSVLRMSRKGRGVVPAHSRLFMPSIRGDLARFKSTKPLLVLDLNGILIHRQREGPAIVNPNVRPILQTLSHRWRLAFWTALPQRAAIRETKQVLLRAELTDRHAVLFVWGQEQCDVEPGVMSNEIAGKPLFRKRLMSVWRAFPRYSSINTIIVDHSQEKVDENTEHCFVVVDKWRPSGTNVRTSDPFSTTLMVLLRRFANTPSKWKDAVLAWKTEHCCKSVAALSPFRSMKCRPIDTSSGTSLTHTRPSAAQLDFHSAVYAWDLTLFPLAAKAAIASDRGVLSNLTGIFNLGIFGVDIVPFLRNRRVACFACGRPTSRRPRTMMIRRTSRGTPVFDGWTVAPFGFCGCKTKPCSACSSPTRMLRYWIEVDTPDDCLSAVMPAVPYCGCICPKCKYQLRPDFRNIGVNIFRCRCAAPCVNCGKATSDRRVKTKGRGRGGTRLVFWDGCGCGRCLNPTRACTCPKEEYSRCTCFTGDCPLRLRDSRRVTVADLVPGMSVATGQRNDRTGRETFRIVKRVWQCRVNACIDVADLGQGCVMTHGHPVLLASTRSAEDISRQMSYAEAMQMSRKERIDLARSFGQELQRNESSSTGTHRKVSHRWVRAEIAATATQGEIRRENHAFVYSIELAGHVDTVDCGGTIVATLGHYCGHNFGWNIFTRKSTRCDANCEICDIIHSPRVDFCSIGPREMVRTYPPHRGFVKSARVI